MTFNFSSGGIFSSGSSSQEESSITVDDSLNATSTNPVENSVITSELKKKQDLLTGTSGVSIYHKTFSTPTSSGGTTGVIPMIYDGSRYFGLAQNSGYTVTSTSGSSYTISSRITNLRYKNWTCLAYNGTTYIAIDGGGYMTKSTDRTSWSSASQISGLNGYSWVNMIYDGSKFILLGSTGYISTSTDGTTWTTPTSALTNKTWSKLIYDGAKYLAISSTGYISTSTNGTTWTTPVFKSELGNNAWNCLSYNGTIYVAMGADGYVSTSTNGSDWSVAEFDKSLNTYVSWQNIIYANNKFLAYDSNLYTSTWDGVYGDLLVDTTPDSSLSSTSTNAVQNKTIYSALNNKQNSFSPQYPLQLNNNTLFLIVDNQLDQNSNNPVTNSAISQALNNIQPPSVSISGGNSITVTSGGGTIDYTSPTQIHPNPDPMQSTQWHAFCSNGTVYVAGGEFGQISTSTDCTNWSAFNMPNVMNTIVSIAYNSGKDAFAFAFGGNYIAFVDSTQIADQNAYMTQSTQNAENIHAVASNGVEFIFGGYDSQNNCGCVGYGDPSVGQIYMDQIIGLECVVKIVIENNIHIALDNYGNLAYRDHSDPMGSWQVVNVTSGGGGGMPDRLLGIAYNGTEYITVTEQGGILTTVGGDITQWQIAVNGFGQQVADFTTDGTTLYVVAQDFQQQDSGKLFVSDATTISFTDYTYQTMGSTYTVFADGNVILVGCEWGYSILYGGAGGSYTINCIVDDHLDSNSDNPVRNSVLYNEIEAIWQRIGGR